MSTKTENTPGLNETDPSRLGMRGRLGFLLKDSILYGGAAAFMQSLSVITFPIMSRHFDVADYGIIDFFGVMGSLLAVFLTFGLDSTIARFFYDKEDHDHRSQVISQALALNLLILLPILGAMYLFSGGMISFVPESPDTSLLIALTVLNAPFMVITSQALNICKWSFARKRYLTLAIGTAVLRVGVLLILILAFDIGVVGIFWMNLGLGAATALLGLAFIIPWLRFPKLGRLTGSMAWYAVPLWLIATMSMLGPFIERSITDSLFGDVALGQYGAGAKIALLMSLPLFAFQMAWGPLSFSIHKQSDSDLTYGIILKLFTLVALGMALTLGALAPLLIWVLAPEDYAAGSVVALPLALGMALVGIQNIIDVGISIKKRSHLRLPAFLAGIGIGLPAIYFLGGALGILGVALGALLMKTTELLVSSWISIRIYPIEWPLKRVTAGCILGLALATALEFSRCLESPIWYGLAGVACLVTFIAAGYRILLNADERRAFWANAHPLSVIRRIQSIGKG